MVSPRGRSSMNSLDREWSLGRRVMESPVQPLDDDKLCWLPIGLFFLLLSRSSQQKTKTWSSNLSVSLLLTSARKSTNAKVLDIVKYWNLWIYFHFSWAGRERIIFKYQKQRVCFKLLSKRSQHLRMLYSL